MRSASALYVSFPDGKPYAKVACDSEREAFFRLRALAAQTQTIAVPCRMHAIEVPYSDMIAPMWEFDMVLRYPGQPDRMVLHAAIRMEAITPTLKPGEHHDPHDSPPAGR